MEKEDQRNFLIAMVLMIGFVWAYQTFIMKPAQERYEAEQAVVAAETPVTENGSVNLPATPAVVEIKDVGEALTMAPRVEFDAASVDGSIRLKGARIDDLSLKKHFISVDKAQEVRIFRPEEAEYGYYASYYWLDANDKPIAGPNTDWQLVGGTKLTEDSPITLRAVSGGITIDRVVSVDSNYMFAFEDTVANNSGQAISVRPYGTIVRKGPYEEFLEATDPGSAKASAMVFMGVIGVPDD